MTDTSIAAQRAELDRLRQERAANRSAPGSAGELIEAIAFDLATGSRVVPPDELHAAIAAHRDESRAAGMREAAAMLRRYCPNHGDVRTGDAFMTCQCAAASALETDANQISQRPGCPDPIECDHEATASQPLDRLLRTLDLIQDEHDHQPQFFKANHDMHAPRLLEIARALRAELAAAPSAPTT